MILNKWKFKMKKIWKLYEAEKYVGLLYTQSPQDREKIVTKNFLQIPLCPLDCLDES